MCIRDSVAPVARARERPRLAAGGGAAGGGARALVAPALPGASMYQDGVAPRARPPPERRTRPHAPR
eukprot:14719457-Alexandrium_andersonii.AAC.1